jgi:RNA recognition motif
LRQKHKDEKGTEISKKRKREAVEDEERGTAIEDSTRPRRNGKLLAQNTVLEKAQNAPLAHEVKSVREEKSKKRKKTKEGEGNKKKLPAEESTSVVEVVYDDSAPQVVEDEPEAEKPPMTDQEWLRARTSRTLGLVSDSEDSDAEHDRQSDNESIASEESEEQSEETTLVTPPATSETAPQPSQNASTAESKILKTGRLFIRNLVYGITEADLREIFSQYGPLVEVIIPAPFSLTTRQ